MLSRLTLSNGLNTKYRLANTSPINRHVVHGEIMRQVLRCTLLDSRIWVLPLLPLVERIQTNHHPDEMSAAPRTTQNRCPTLASSAHHARVPQVCRLTPSHHPRLNRASTPAHHPLASRVPPESVASPPLSPPPSSTGHARVALTGHTHVARVRGLARAHHPLVTRVCASAHHPLVTRVPESVPSPPLRPDWVGWSPALPPPLGPDAVGSAGCPVPGPARYCSPPHSTHLEPSFLDFNGII